MENEKVVVIRKMSKKEYCKKNIKTRVKTESKNPFNSPVTAVSSSKSTNTLPVKKEPGK